MALSKSIVLFSLCFALAIPALIQAQPTVTVVATFPSGRGQAYFPGQLMQGGGGNFYGATLKRGTHNAGTIFLMNQQGNLKTLFNFNQVSGTLPNGPLVAGRDGYLYGTTHAGGSSGTGTIFKISRTGGVQVLHNFCAPLTCLDGARPTAGLVRGVDGSFYGTTLNGGMAGAGVVFRIGPNGTYKVLHRFNHPNNGIGAYPMAALLQASDSNLYGLSSNGGTYQTGTIFMVTPDGQAKLFYSFGALNRLGWDPVGSLIQASDGDFYGATYYGGANNYGTIFKISLQGVYHKIYDFPNLHHPFYPPIQASDGDLWGIMGGSQVYAITTSGSFVQGFDMYGQAGLTATTPLIQAADGRLYGGANLPLAKEGIYAIDAGLPPPSPSIAGFLPAHGPVGSTVVVSGAHFVGTTGVTFNGVSVAFVINADGVISATVPPGASTGPIQVNNAGGFAATQTDFIVP